MLESALLLMPTTDSNNIEGQVEECGSSSNVCKYGGGCVMEGGHTNCIIDSTLSIPAAVATHTNVINTHIDDEVGVDVYLPMGIGCNEDGLGINSCNPQTQLYGSLAVGLYNRRMSIAAAIIRLGFGVGVFLGLYTGIVGGLLAAITPGWPPIVFVLGFFVAFFIGFFYGFLLGSIGGVVVVILMCFVSFVNAILMSIIRSFFSSRDP